MLLHLNGHLMVSILDGPYHGSPMLGLLFLLIAGCFVLLADQFAHDARTIDSTASRSRARYESWFFVCLAVITFGAAVLFAAPARWSIILAAILFIASTIGLLAVWRPLLRYAKEESEAHEEGN
jgi:uncharacterized membrane protein